MLPVATGPLLHRTVGQADHQAVPDGQHRSNLASPARVLQLPPVGASPLLNRTVGEADDETVLVAGHRLDVLLVTDRRAAGEVMTSSPTEQLPEHSRNDSE